MDVLLTRRSLYSIPSRQRVGALVYDGASDMQLWPGPGPDRELRDHYGDRLQQALDAEFRHSGGRELPIPSVIRVHPGRLHCDFLAWVATREPEPGSEQSPAPDAERLKAAVFEALRFVAERSVERVAMAALGHGPGELPRADRIALIVEAAHEYEERCFKEGRAAVVEEVIVCEPLASIYRTAQQKVRGLARASEPTPAARTAPEPRPRAGKAPRKPAAPKKPVVDPAQWAAAHSLAEPYSMRERYSPSQWLMHPKFGLGRVEEATIDGAIVVIFEDGSLKKLAHGRG